jgi:hypothetical protein
LNFFPPSKLSERNEGENTRNQEREREAFVKHKRLQKKELIR